MTLDVKMEGRTLREPFMAGNGSMLLGMDSDRCIEEEALGLNRPGMH